MSIYDLWEISDAKQAVGDVQHPLADTNRKFFEGDHWQDVNGWIGPKPRVSDEGYDETMLEIMRAFTSRNVIAEGVTRHEDAVIGQLPLWGLTPRRALKQEDKPNDTEQAKIDEAEAALTVWWDNRKVHDAIKLAVQTALWASRGVIRFYIPSRFLTITVDGEGRVTRTLQAANLDDALGMLYIENPVPEGGAVIEDAVTKLSVGVVVSADDDGNDVAELTYLDDGITLGGRPVAGTKPMTVMRRIERDVDVRVLLPLGGRLPMYELQRPILVTEQVQQAQRALNLALSMVPRNVISGGFLERVLLNAQMPGEWELDAQGNKVRFKPAEYVTGAGTTNFVSGLDYEAEDGRTALANPQVVFREPTPVEPAIDAKETHYQDALGEMKQEHILIQGDATASGKSRETARADFEKSLQKTEEPTDGLGRWLLETALAMAEAILGQPGNWTNVLRSRFEARLEAGQISPDEQTKVVEQHDKGLLSRETAMERVGVPDVDAEQAKIESQPSGQLELRTKRATLLITLLEKMQPKQAAQLAGFTEEEAAVIIAGVKPDPVPVVAANGTTGNSRTTPSRNGQGSRVAPRARSTA